MASVSSKVEMVVGIVMNLPSKRAICSLEASPVPVMLILIFFGAYSKMGIFRCRAAAMATPCVRINDLQCALKYSLQFEIRIGHFFHVNDSRHDKFRFAILSGCPKNCISHEVCTGVYPHD